MSPDGSCLVANPNSRSVRTEAAGTRKAKLRPLAYIEPVFGVGVAGRVIATSLPSRVYACTVVFVWEIAGCVKKNRARGPTLAEQLSAVRWNPELMRAVESARQYSLSI